MAVALLGWIYISAQAFALVRMLLSGTWRIAPCFWLMLISHTVQSIRVNQADGPIITVDWWEREWIPTERILLVLAVLAMLECAYRATAQMEDTEKYGMRFGLLLPCAAAWLISPFTEVRTLGGFMQLREYVWSASALSLICLVLFLFLKPLPFPRAFCNHLLLLCALYTAHAFTAPVVKMTGKDWFQQQAAFRCIAFVLFVRWGFMPPLRVRAVEPAAVPHP